jgi:hypothetical protein
MIVEIGLIEMYMIEIDMVHYHQLETVETDSLKLIFNQKHHHLKLVCINLYLYQVLLSN